MARVTIEDCIVRIPSPFTLTHIAAKRARQLARGAPSQWPVSEHKATVIALQEIAGGHVTEAILDEVDLPVIERPKFDLDPLELSFK